MNRLMAVAIGTLSPMIGYGHHNSAPLYDLAASATVAGIVIEVRFVNPHARIYFEVSDGEGDAVLWMAEGANPLVLRRLGWTGEEMQPGDHVRITGSPSRDGSPMIEWRTITLPDGTELGGGNGTPAEQSRLLERLEQQRRASRRDE